MLTQGQSKGLQEQGDDGTKPSALLRGVSSSAEKDLMRSFISKAHLSGVKPGSPGLTHRPDD